MKETPWQVCTTYEGRNASKFVDYLETYRSCRWMIIWDMAESCELTHGLGIFGFDCG